MSETETDIEVLLECLKCQRNDAIGLKRTLSTLLSILGSDGEWPSCIFFTMLKIDFKIVSGVKFIYRIQMLTTWQPGNLVTHLSWYIFYKTKSV